MVGVKEHPRFSSSSRASRCCFSRESCVLNSSYSRLKIVPCWPSRDGLPHPPTTETTPPGQVLAPLRARGLGPSMTPRRSLCEDSIWPRAGDSLGQSPAGLVLGVGGDLGREGALAQPLRLLLFAQPPDLVLDMISGLGIVMSGHLPSGSRKRALS
jgi:hypothetical protein